MKISIATTFLISVILCSALLDLTNAASATPSQPLAQSPQASGGGFCNNKCGVRCALKGVNSRCMKYCMMCCGKCRCVPSGHLDECPCYRDWKSPNGRPKCP